MMTELSANHSPMSLKAESKITGSVCIEFVLVFGNFIIICTQNYIPRVPFSCHKCSSFKCLSTQDDVDCPPSTKQLLETLMFVTKFCA